MWSARFLFLLLVPCAFSQDAGPIIARAKLTGFVDRPIESDRKITRVEIVAKIQVAVPGDYRLTFELKAQDGSGLTGRADGRLQTGAHELTASFDAGEILNNLKQDGPYTISDARLFLETAGGATLADSSSSAVSTRPYRLADLFPYYFTGEIEAEGIDVQASGKFGALRVRVGVETPGAACGGYSTLFAGGTRIEYRNAEWPQRLPSGKGALEFIFQGAKIAAHGFDGPLVISDLLITCTSGPMGPDWKTATFAERGPLRTKPLRASDFDNPPPDFVLGVTQASYRTASGDRLNAEILFRSIGFGSGQVVLTVRSDPRLQILTAPPPADLGSWWDRDLRGQIGFQVPRDLPPGDYPIQVTGRNGERQHTVAFTIVVEAERTRLARDREDMIAALVRPDPAPSTPPKPGALPDESVDSAARFSAEVSLRKIHAVLVMDHSLSAGFFPGCSVMNAAAIRFSRLFVEGRDSLAAVSFGINAAVVLPLTDRFQGDLDQRIRNIPCSGLASNMGAALEAAQQELAKNVDPDAIDVVILIAVSHPTAFTATWSTNRQPDGTYCAESEGGRVTAILQNRYAMPLLQKQLPGTLRSSVGPLFLPLNFQDPLEPTLFEQSMDRNQRLIDFDNKPKSCFGYGYHRSGDTYAVIPETDVNGVSFTGRRPLERFAAGPYVNQVRLDVSGNFSIAAENQTENVARMIRSGPQPALLNVISVIAQGPALLTAAWTDLFRKLANQPGSASFDPAQTAGNAILVDRLEALWPAFERVRKDVVDRATTR